MSTNYSQEHRLILPSVEIGKLKFRICSLTESQLRICLLAVIDGSFFYDALANAENFHLKKS